MDDLEFDSKGNESRSRGILQKFNMLFQAELNDELQALLFQKVHRYTYDSTVKALDKVAPESNSFQKPAEHIGRVAKWLLYNGDLSPADAVDTEDWWVVGTPVRVKAGRAHHPGWIYSSDMVSGVVFYRRNPIGRDWNCIYCPPYCATQGDGPEMPGPIQSLAVRMILAKFPMGKIVDGKFNEDLVNRYILRMPWDNAKVQRELTMYYREKALGHPLGPRGWDDAKTADAENEGA